MKEINKIYNEDCLVGMKDIEDKSIDCIICDLPYGVLNKGNKHAKWDCPIPFDELWKEYERIIKDNGAIVLFGSGMFTAELMTSNKKLWKYNLIWDKCRATGFLNAKKMPLRYHEDICVFYKSLPTYNPQMTKCEPHQRNHSRGKQQGKQTNRCYGVFGKAEDIITDEKYPRSIISIQQKIQGNIHPTQKPIDLIRYLIRTYSNEGEVILDNCMGSGTTAIACLREKRNFIGFELNEEYYKKSVERVNNEINQLMLDL